MEPHLRHCYVWLCSNAALRPQFVAFPSSGWRLTVASPFPLTAVTLVGAFGTVAGVTELLVADAVLVPIVFIAVTVNVYVVPFVSPVTIIGELPPVAENPPVFEVTT